jgi:tRNA uracil 4-sulfurtransferase
MSASKQYVVVHFGEVSLKGKNRPAFLRQLTSNIVQALSDYGNATVQRQAGRMLVTLSAGIPQERLHERLQQVFGIANFAVCATAPHQMEAIQHAVSRVLAGKTFASFRITARRAFKELPWTSEELNRVLGTHVLSTHQTRVNLEHPELVVHVEVIPRHVLVYVDKIPGLGGLPSGTGGTLLNLLSGGFDSPVAAYRMIKRGCRVDFVHFHSYPFLDRTSQEKARQLARLLTRHQYASRLFMVPFGEVQQHIVSAVPPSYRVVLYRRYMLRLAAMLAQQTGALALVTGESLGQVASQTLPNLAVIEAASPLPILRPLIGMDKTEILAEAQTIGTYTTSILPDQDCCTLFVPRHPATKTVLADIEKVEQGLDMPALLQLALHGLQTTDLHFPEMSGGVEDAT